MSGAYKAAIWIQDLTRSFPRPRDLRSLIPSASRPTSVDVLRGVNLEVFAGEVVGLVGPNGAGKTTLLEILSTLLLPSGGRAQVCGHDVVHNAARVRDAISYCASNSHAFYPRLTGSANLEFFAALNNLRPRDAREKIGQLMSLVGLESAADTRFQCYSEGMKQRLVLARALLGGASVLLLDEPTKGLDAAMQGEVQQFLRRTLVQKMGKTVLLVTHSPAEAKAVCDRVAILRDGLIVRVGTPSAALPSAVGVFHRAPAASESCMGSGA